MLNDIVIDQGHGIFTIDTGFLRKGLVASHLIQQGDRYAFVDVGTTSCLPVIHAVMADMGIRPEQVDYVMVTHVHLDHAGAAGSLMQELPKAQLVVHPRGARHMIDPSKLIAGAAAVYGEDVLRDTFGEILPVPAERVVEATDEMILALNGRELVFIDTPGHAKHHYCVYDELSQGFFTGDTFGLAYPPLAVNGKPFVFPTTTPVQFDPAALHASIDRIMEYKPERMFLTHFGCLSDTQYAAQQLHESIDAHANLADDIAYSGTEDCESKLYAALKDYLFTALRKFGSRLTDKEVLSYMDMDLHLNAQGLCCWLEYKKSGK
jgi:glyoxylase-like metal-dependent hydrolase (beta-lactamase superfamily II)